MAAEQDRARPHQRGRAHPAHPEQARAAGHHPRRGEQQGPGRPHPHHREVFDVYKELCKNTGSDILTQRRITDLISELDMLGIFTARVISKAATAAPAKSR